MTPEWYFMLLGNPQGFWKLLNHYLTALYEQGYANTKEKLDKSMGFFEMK